MTERDTRAIARNVQTAVEAVSGVSAVFRAGSTARKVIESGMAQLGIRESDPTVVVRDGASGMRVDVAIGVQSSAGAAVVAHRAHGAVEAALARDGVTGADIRLTVVHIDDSVSAG